MKFHLVILSIVCLMFFACKKERTCSCKVNTSGIRTTHSKSDAVSATINIGLPIPVPIPPVELIPAKDTTFIAPYNYTDENKKNYDKVSNGTMKKICQSAYEEDYTNNYSTVSPGTSTVTVSEAGTKKYTCEIK